MGSNLTVVIVQRHDGDRAELRKAFGALTGIQIAGERSDLRAGLSLAHQVRPDILVLELANPVEDGLHAAAQYKLEFPDCAIFLSTEVFDPDTLLRAIRAGASEILRRPLDRAALSQAVERVAALNARKQGATVARRVITVFSNKGGAGVSTIATNLAISLCKLGQREVVLVDFDYQSGDVASMLGVSPKRSLADVTAAPKIDSAAVQDALTKHPSGILVLPQPEHVDQMESLAPKQVGTVLEILSATFENVVVDAPHIFDETTLEIFDRSSTVLLIAEASIPSVRAARRSLELFSRLNYLTIPDRVRLVVNRRSDSGAITIEQMKETLGMPVFASVANDYAAVSNAINMGKPLCGETFEGRAGRDIAALTQMLVPVENTGTAPEAAPARRGRLRLFGRG